MSSGRRSDVEIKIESSSERGNSIISRIYIKRKKEENCESLVWKEKSQVECFKRIDFVKSTFFWLIAKPNLKLHQFKVQLK